MTAASLGALVRQLRGDMTQAELATKAGISDRLVSAVEVGRRNLGADNVDALADALNLTDDQRAALHEARRAHKDAGGVIDQAIADAVRQAIAPLEQRVADLESRLEGSGLLGFSHDQVNDFIERYRHLDERTAYLSDRVAELIQPGVDARPAQARRKR